MQPTKAPRVVLAAIITLGCLAQKAEAHSGADDRIHQLTHKLQRAPSAELYLRRALLYLEDSAHRKARRDLHRASKLGANQADVLWIRARLELDDDKPKASITALDRLAKQSKLHPSHSTLRARALMAQGKPAEAAAQLALSIELSATPSANLFLEHASALNQAGLREEIVATLSRGLRAVPASTPLQTRLIDELVALGRHQDIARQVQTLPARLQASPKYQLVWADALVANGQGMKACEHFAAAASAISRLPPKRQQAPAFAGLKTRAAQGTSHCKKTQ